jgi:sarcosine oxidase
MHDVIVVGLGAAGAATAYQLTRAGARVLGLDRYAPPHALGSSHGDTRITRVGIGEGAAYVPLARRSHEIWREVEAATGVSLLEECGGLVMAVPGERYLHGSTDFLGQTVGSAVAHGVEHELLTADQIAARWPEFALRGDERGYYEPGAGYVRPERCVGAQLALARAAAADLLIGEAVRTVTGHRAGVTVTTDRGEHHAGAAVVAGGAWMPALVPELAPHLQVHRQVLCWYDLADRAAYPGYRDLPVYIWEFGPGTDDFVYGFPMVDGPGGGLKVAPSTYDQPTDPDSVARTVDPAEAAAQHARFVAGRFPGIGPAYVRATVCLYTVTPDAAFVLGAHPSQPNVFVASPCSGHGFKHSAAVGEALAQLALTGRSETDLSAFSYERFSAPGRGG